MTTGTTAGTAVTRAARSARIEGGPETDSTTTPVSTPTEEAPPRRPRRPRRRRAAISKWAQPVYPIKAIWDAATEEERQRARELATELLGLWLGQQTKEDLAKRLSVPPIRVWQMSQRAVAGMVASMLRPPLGRRGAMPRQDPEVRALRTRVAGLEKDLEVSRRLVSILRTMPGNERREVPEEAEGAARNPTRGVRTRKARRPGTARRGAADAAAGD